MSEDALFGGLLLYVSDAVTYQLPYHNGRVIWRVM